MSRVQLVYTKHALSNLKALDKKIALRIVKKVTANSALDNPLARAKALTGSLQGKYRYRVGDYRVIFTVDATGTVTILTVITIQHRKDIYR